MRAVDLTGLDSTGLDWTGTSHAVLYCTVPYGTVRHERALDRTQILERLGLVVALELSAHHHYHPPPPPSPPPPPPPLLGCCAAHSAKRTRTLPYVRYGTSVLRSARLASCPVVHTYIRTYPVRQEEGAGGHVFSVGIVIVTRWNRAGIWLGPGLREGRKARKLTRIPQWTVSMKSLGSRLADRLFRRCCVQTVRRPVKHKGVVMSMFPTASFFSRSTLDVKCEEG